MPTGRQTRDLPVSVKPPVWAELPNAKHIDRLIASRRKLSPVSHAAWVIELGAAWNDAWGKAWSAADEAGRLLPFRSLVAQYTDNTRYALMALVACDEACEYVGHTVEQLQVLHRLTKHPMYLLLQSKDMK